jgi:hypothetical protein
MVNLWKSPFTGASVSFSTVDVSRDNFYAVFLSDGYSVRKSTTPSFYGKSNLAGIVVGDNRDPVAYFGNLSGNIFLGFDGDVLDSLSDSQKNGFFNKLREVGISDIEAIIRMVK